MIRYGKEKDECHFDCIIHLIDKHRFSSEAQVLNGKECPDLDCDASAATLRYLIDLIEKEPKDFEPSELNCECSVKNNVPDSIPKALNTKLLCSSLYQSSHIISNIPDLEVGACIEVLGETDSDSKYSSISEPFSDCKTSVDEKELLTHSSSYCTEDLDIGANILVNSEENDFENYPNHINQSVFNALITSDVTFTAGANAMKENSDDLKNNQKEQLQHTPYIEDKVDKIDKYEGSELHNTESDFDHLKYITYTDENCMRIRQIDETDLKVANEISNKDNSVNENEILPNNLEYNSPGRSHISDSKVINDNNCHEAVIKEPDNTLEQEKHNGVCFSTKTSPPVINSETYSENLKLENFQNYEISGFNVFTSKDENAEKDAKLNPVSNTDRKQIIEPKDAENVQKLVPCISAMPTLHEHEKFECEISEPTTPKQFSQSSDLINKASNTLSDMLNEKDEKHSTLVKISNSDRKVIVEDPKESDSCIEPPVNSNANPVLDENVKEKHSEVHIAQSTTPVSSDDVSNSYDLNSEYIQLMSPPPSFLSDLKQPSQNPSVQSKLPNVENYQENGNDGKSDFIKIRKNSITIQQILKEREEQKKHQEKITMLQQKFQNEEQLNVEDDFSDDDERQDFLNSKECLAYQESQSSIIQEDRTNNPPPGLNIFEKGIFSYFTYQDITLKNCGYTNSGLTKFEEMVLNLPSVTLSENLPSILNNYQLYNVTNHNSFLLYLFKMAAVNDPLSVSCCEKTIKRICCDNDPKINVSWCPPPVNILEVFLNYGIDTEVQCPLRNALQKVENNLTGQAHGFQSNSKEKSKIRNCLPKNCRWSATNLNLDSTLNILSTLIDNCCLYSDEELCDIIILLLWISLDRNILGTKTEVNIENCIASAVKQISPKSWKIQAEILAGTICSLSQHHRNILNIISLLPISIQRERKLQQAISYLALQILLDCEKKVFVLEIKLDLILHLLKNKQLHKIQDFYLLHTIVSLIDLCVGYEPHHDQMDILDRLGVYFVNTHSKIADDARYPESTQVKSHLIRTQCKWKLLNPNVKVEKNLFMNKTSVEAVNQEIKKISTENNGNSVIEEELKKIPLVDSTPDVNMDKNVNAGIVLESEITIEKTESDLSDSGSDEMLIAKIFDSHDGNTLGEEDINNLDFNCFKSSVAEDKLLLEHYKAQNTDSDDEKVMDKIFSCQNIQAEILDLNTKFSDNKINGAVTNSHKLEQRNKNTDSSNDSDDENMMDLLCTGPEAQKFLEKIKLNSITSSNHRNGVSEKYTVTENMSSKNQAITECVKHVTDNSIGMGEMKVLPEKLDQIRILNNISHKSVTESFTMKSNVMNYVGSKDMPSVPFQHISTKSLSSNICEKRTEVINELHCGTNAFDRNEGNPNISTNALEFVANKQSDTPTMNYFQNDSNGGNNKPVCALSVPVAQEFELPLDDNSNNTEFSLESITNLTHIKMEEYLNIDNQDAIEHVNITADENERSPKSVEPLPCKFLRTADNFEILGTTNFKDLLQPVSANTDSKQTKSLQMENLNSNNQVAAKAVFPEKLHQTYISEALNSVNCKNVSKSFILNDYVDSKVALIGNNNVKDLASLKGTETSIKKADLDLKAISMETSHLTLEEQAMRKSETYGINCSKGSPESSKFLCKELQKTNTQDDLNSINCEDLPKYLVTNSNTNDFLQSMETEKLLAFDLKSNDANTKSYLNPGNQAVPESMTTIHQGNVRAEAHKFPCKGLSKSIVPPELLLTNHDANDFVDSKECELLIPKNNSPTGDIISEGAMMEPPNLNLPNQAAAECVNHINANTKSKKENALLSEKLDQMYISGASNSIPCKDVSKCFIVKDCVDSKETPLLPSLHSEDIDKETSHLIKENCTAAKNISFIDHSKNLKLEEFAKLLDNVNNSNDLNTANSKDLPVALINNVKDLVGSKRTETIDLKHISMETSHLTLGKQTMLENETPYCHPHTINHNQGSPGSSEFLCKELQETNNPDDLNSGTCEDFPRSLIMNTNSKNFLHSKKTEKLLEFDLKSSDANTKTSYLNLEKQAVKKSDTRIINISKGNPESSEFLCKELPEENTSEGLNIVNCKDLTGSLSKNSNVKGFLHSNETESLLAIDFEQKETSIETLHLNMENETVEKSETPIFEQSKGNPESGEFLCKELQEANTLNGLNIVNCKDLPGTLNTNSNANDCLHSSETESLLEIDFQSKDLRPEPSNFNLENQSVEESAIPVGHNKVSPESSEFLNKELPETNVSEDLTSVNCKDLQNSLVTNSKVKDFVHSSDTGMLLRIDFMSKETSRKISHLDLGNQAVAESTMPVDQGIDGGQELNGYLCEELPATTIPQCLSSDNYGDSQDPSVENSNADNSKQEASLIANNAQDLLSSKNANTSLQLDMCAEVANENCTNRLENECSNKYIQEPIDCDSFTNTVNNVSPSEVIDLCDSDSCSTIFLTESDDDDCVIESITPRGRSNVIVIDFTDEESDDI